LGTGDIDTMQAMASIRIPDSSMTPLLACLFSEASGHWPISTGKERDTESGNDNFGARYYASTMGRFMSPDFNDTDDDPDAVPFADLENPQSLNLYNYVLNNPLTKMDPDGHFMRVPNCGCPPPPDYSHLEWEIEDYIDRVKRGFPLLYNQYFGKKTPTVPFVAAPAQSTPADPNQKKPEESKPKKPTSTNQMQKQVEAGKAPKSVDRVDTPRYPNEKPHIEFNDGNALNNDGTWKHGGRPLTNEEAGWVTKNGWTLPK